MNPALIFSVLIGIAALLFLVLVVRLHAFMALLIASILSGLIAGLDGGQIMASMQKGMADTLGFVAVVVGLGAMFGAVLEISGGAQATASALMKRFGVSHAPWAMLIAGFMIAIPVFFDVAFIILIPMIYGLQRRSGMSLLLFALPLLAGLAVAHAFVPPTPGPVAVADILGADLGMVILAGLVTGFPAALAGGIFFGAKISRKIFIPAPAEQDADTTRALPPAGLVYSLIAIPILLILIRSITQHMTTQVPIMNSVMSLAGHPFTALLVANLLAWYFLGIRRGLGREKLLSVSARSLAPAGTIILLTGAGGVFKQILVDTGSGEMLATSLSSAGIPVVLFAFFAAAAIRVMQGSATVAMITAAGLTAPLLPAAQYSSMQLACIVIAIASGATVLSHVNDSGFWLVSQYLGLTEKQTFRSWTMMTVVMGMTGLVCASILYSLS